MSTESKIYMKIITRRNLKMTAAKIASQAAHAALGLMNGDPRRYYAIVVTQVTDKKFEEIKAKVDDGHIVVDAGLTEVPPNTETALAYWEEKEISLPDIDKP